MHEKLISAIYVSESFCWLVVFVHLKVVLLPCSAIQAGCCNSISLLSLCDFLLGLLASKVECLTNWNMQDLPT